MSRSVDSDSSAGSPSGLELAFDVQVRPLSRLGKTMKVPTRRPSGAYGFSSKRLSRPSIASTRSMRGSTSSSGSISLSTVSTRTVPVVPTSSFGLVRLSFFLAASRSDAVSCGAPAVLRASSARLAAVVGRAGGTPACRRRRRRCSRRSTLRAAAASACRPVRRRASLAGA